MPGWKEGEIRWRYGAGKTGAESSTGDFMPIRSENPSYPSSSRGKIAVKNLSRAGGSIEKEKLPWARWNFPAM